MGEKLTNHIKRIETIQDKAIRIINFASYNAPTNNLYKESKILKFTDGIKLKHFLFVVDNIKKLSFKTHLYQQKKYTIIKHRQFIL